MEDPRPGTSSGNQPILPKTLVSKRTVHRGALTRAAKKLESLFDELENTFLSDIRTSELSAYLEALEHYRGKVLEARNQLSGIFCELAEHKSDHAEVHANDDGVEQERASPVLFKSAFLINDIRDRLQPEPSQRDPTIVTSGDGAKTGPKTCAAEGYKPGKLSLDNTLPEFRIWSKRFLMYAEASGLADMPISEQQVFTYKCVDLKL